ncbi:HNH endonuclease [Mycobacteroides chelonae]|uniref:HNH endonuclease n=1 Tax=Mycobacteroides chelonae TaxID=1774 RepID=UPI000991E179|nr:HNH endonuclease signature motif containing protein [Mycobacteroides chelonae]
MSWSSSDRKHRLPPDWGAICKRILSRDNYTCRLRLLGCLDTASEVDHIIPNDDHSDENLRAVCRFCHSKKSSAEGHARQRELRARRKRPPERHPGIR